VIAAKFGAMLAVMYMRSSCSGHENPSKSLAYKTMQIGIRFDGGA